MHTARYPRVYRYLEKQYVDEFFDNGRLRLSSFQRFASHKDDLRFDENEGQVSLFHRTSENGGQTLYVSMGFDNNAYVLCGSTIPSVPLMKKFQTDSAIIIRDVPGFIRAVAAKIPGVIRTVHGVCSYQSTRAIERDLGWIDLADGPTDDPTNVSQIELQEALCQLVTDDVLFLKNWRFAKQVEYRLLWVVPQPESFLDVHVPDAIQFCERWENHGWVAVNRYQRLRDIRTWLRKRWRLLSARK
jgi:hypothetical protein